MYKQISKIIYALLIISSSLLNGDVKLPTLQEMLNASNLNLNIQEINSAKVIVLAREDQEITDTSIALSMGLYVKAPYDEVTKELKKSGENILSDYEDALFIRIDDLKNIEPYFDKVVFTSRENNEVEKLFDYTRGEAFNLSEKEIIKWKNFSKRGERHNLLASTFFKQVLRERMQAYLDGGIDNITKYEHLDSDNSVVKGMKSSSNNLGILKKYYPELYNYYMNYPNIKSKGYTENFYLIKDKLEGRPTFILKHQVVKAKNKLLVILERQFYISHDLDAIQTQIICIPYKDGTFVGLSSQSFTPKVSGFSRRISVKVGRHMMEKELLPIFESLQQKFNR